MTDWPEAVREYEEHTTWRGGMAPGDLDKWWKEQREAIVKYGPPAIAALKEMQMDTIEVLNDCQAEMGRQCARAEKAEANCAEWRQKYRTLVYDKGGDRLANAEAEVERLREAHNSCINHGEMLGMKVVALSREVERLEWMLDLAWTERRKIQVERKYGISLRTKKMWLANLAARYEKGHT